MASLFRTLTSHRANNKQQKQVTWLQQKLETGRARACPSNYINAKEPVSLTNQRLKWIATFLPTARINIQTSGRWPGAQCCKSTDNGRKGPGKRQRACFKQTTENRVWRNLAKTIACIFLPQQTSNSWNVIMLANVSCFANVFDECCGMNFARAFPW